MWFALYCCKFSCDSECCSSSAAEESGLVLKTSCRKKPLFLDIYTYRNSHNLVSPGLEPFTDISTLMSVVSEARHLKTICMYCTQFRCMSICNHRQCQSRREKEMTYCPLMLVTWIQLLEENDTWPLVSKLLFVSYDRGWYLWTRVSLLL